MSGPYAEAAWAYRSVGWAGPLPVAAKGRQLGGRRVGTGKSPIPSGFTGYAGAWPSGPDVQAWCDGPEAGDNIALRLPETVYGLDVDAYGDKHGAATLAALVAQAGPLPSTWSSTSRGPGQPARIHLFRAALPDGRLWVNKPGGEGSGIESVHYAHRYAVVAPSIHPDTEQPYRWYRPDGTPSDRPPRPDELAELPAAWVALLSKDGSALLGGSASRDETLTAVHAFRAAPNTMCVPVQLVLHAELERLAGVGRGQGDLHDPSLAGILALVGYGFEGHIGVAAALAHHYDAFVAAGVACQRRTHDAADAEWFRMAQGAVGKMATTHGGAIATNCWCEAPPFGPSELEQQQLRVDVRTGTVAAPVSSLDRDTLLLELLGLPDLVERPARARQVAEQIIAQHLAGFIDDQTKLEWRDWLKEFGCNKGEFDALEKARHTALKEVERARRAAEHAHARAAVAEGGLLMPSPAEPMKVARELFARGLLDPAAHAHWRGEFYGWTGTHWVPGETAWYRRLVYLTTEDARYDAGEAHGLQPWQPGPGSVSATLDALATIFYRPGSEDDERCLALTNGVYDIAGRQLMPHAAGRFNLAALPHAYDPAATAPGWERFLVEVLPEPEARALLQEWFGYVLSGATDRQKIMMMVGQKRSGKGTINRVLTALLGQHNVAQPTLPSLADSFGEAPLIGRMLAVLSDVDWRVREAGSAVETLKAISGEDSRTVNRKNLPHWHGRLGVRFQLMSNDDPSFRDDSGALASRLLHLRFPNSFIGREEIGLTDRLLTELPGILNWALAGLAALSTRGDFTLPPSAADAAADTERASNPARAFVEDCCEIDGRTEIELHILFQAYELWCTGEGRTVTGIVDSFARALRGAYRGQVVIERIGARGSRRRVVRGVRLLGVMPAHAGMFAVPYGVPAQFPGT